MATEIHTLSPEAAKEIIRQYWEMRREFKNLQAALNRQQQWRHHATYPAVEKFAFRNDSGEEVPAFGVMRVVDTTGTGKNTLHEIAKPNTDFKCRYLVNLDRAIPEDGYGFGTWLTESSQVLYNASSGTPAIDEEWGAKSGQWSLEKNRPGFLITGGNDTTATTTRAMQRIVTNLKGKADGAISKGSTGAVSIWMGAGGSEADTSMNITCRAYGAAITSGKIVVVWFESGVWYVGPWEC